MMENRLARVRAIMAAQGLDQLLITRPQSIFYLTGQWVEPFDRLDALVITPDGCRMLCYVLAVIRPEDCQVSVYSDTGETIPRLSELMDAGVTGVDGFLQSRFLLPLMQLRPDLKLRVSQCVDEARRIKDEAEIALLRRAGAGTYRVRVIHGSHGGTALRDFIRTEYGHHPRVKRLLLSPDGGATELVLREYV